MGNVLTGMNPVTKKFNGAKAIVGKPSKCFKGYALTGSYKGTEFTLISPNVDDLKTIWDLFMKIPVDDSIIQPVAIFAQQQITEVSKRP